MKTLSQENTEEAREVAQSVKQLLHQHEALSSVPSAHIKTGTVTHSYILSTAEVKQEHLWSSPVGQQGSDTIVRPCFQKTRWTGVERRLNS